MCMILFKYRRDPRLRGRLSSQSLSSEVWCGVQIIVLYEGQRTLVQPEEIVKQRGPDVLVETAIYVRIVADNCSCYRWLDSLNGPYMLYLSIWALARSLAAGCTGFLPHGTTPRRRDGLELNKSLVHYPTGSSLKLATLEESELGNSVLLVVADIWRQAPGVTNANPVLVRG